MEKNKIKTKQYLQTHVRPIVAPLMEALALEQPQDILKFTQDYINKLVAEKQQQSTKTISSASLSEDQKKKIQQRLEKGKNEKKSSRTSRRGVSAEVFGKYNKKGDFTPIVIEKDGNVKTKIKNLIKRSIILGFLQDKEMDIVIDAMTVEQVKSGDFIIKEKEKGEKVYIVGGGQFSCSKIIDGKSTFLKTYKIGDMFGQLALMYNAPRAATIECSSPEGVVYGLDRMTFQNIVQEATQAKRQKYMDYLKSIKILGQIDPYEREQLSDILSEEEFSEGNVVVKEGQEGTKFYLIIEGKLAAEKEGKKVYEFKKGDYFGQIALVRNTPRQATVKCMTKCTLLSIEREAFKRILGPLQQILKRNQQKYKQFAAL